MVTATVTAVAVALTVCAEWLHLRRRRGVAFLAFGPRAVPAGWVRAAPVVRALSIGALVWGLATLLSLAPHAAQPAARAAQEERHLVLVLDVSPSMKLRDAGPLHDCPRAERAGAVVRAILDRIATEHVRYSVIAVYNGAKRVASDTKDLAIVYNILNNLPMTQAFDIGKTTLAEGVAEAADMAADWPADSTTVLIVSDGDTALGDAPRRMPPSVADVLVLGVGNPRAGTYIDGHLSYQDQHTLDYLATRLSGRYHNANEIHAPAALLRHLATQVPVRAPAGEGLRAAALGATGAGAALSALLPVALALYGAQWRAGVQQHGGRT